MGVRGEGRRIFSKSIYAQGLLTLGKIASDHSSEEGKFCFAGPSSSILSLHGSLQPPDGAA